MNHNHTPEPAEKVVADITAAGGTAIPLAADVASRAEYAAMVNRLLAEFGRWDILVTHAAVAITKPFAEITEAEFDLSFHVNVKAMFRRHGNCAVTFSHLARWFEHRAGDVMNAS